MELSGTGSTLLKIANNNNNNNDDNRGGMEEGWCSVVLGRRMV
jgi:hypothetical protein